MLKDNHRHWCFILSIGSCAGLELCKPHLQSWQLIVCELTGVLPKKFTFTAILQLMKYGFCGTIRIIFLSSWLFAALGWPDYSLRVMIQSLCIIGKCGSLYHAPDYITK